MQAAYIASLVGVVLLSSCLVSQNKAPDEAKPRRPAVQSTQPAKPGVEVKSVPDQVAAVPQPPTPAVDEPVLAESPALPRVTFEKNPVDFGRVILGSGPVRKSVVFTFASNTDINRMGMEIAKDAGDAGNAGGFTIEKFQSLVVEKEPTTVIIRFDPNAVGTQRSYLAIHLQLPSLVVKMGLVAEVVAK